MFEYLVDHAVQNVWCNPEQDNQLIFCAHRVSKITGELNRTMLMDRLLVLPVTGKRFHIFQIGQATPNLLGLLSIDPSWVEERWIKFSDAINEQRLFVNIYTDSGIELPKFKSYYMFTKERNLIFAIENDNKFPIDYTTDLIYTRFYSNAYFQSVRADRSVEYITCVGKVIKNVQHILDMQVLCNTYRAKDGFVYCYKNGLLVDKIDLVNIAVGDTIEFIYDSSIKKVVTFLVNDLRTFDSILDNTAKYLLHHSDTTNETIDYHDDLDIHILHHTNAERYKGYYYHRNSPDSHRMVTHRDYSIRVDYFNNTATHLNNRISDEPLDFLQLKVQVKIRDAGYKRPLIFDNSRIFELYKLPDDKLLNAMVGMDSTLEEWKAENLENNAYSLIMRSGYGDITIQNIQSAYGYNGITKIVADTPTKTVLREGKQQATLPYALQQNSTIYEYDVNGKMLGYFYHAIGSEYECTFNTARYIEAISGHGTNRPDDVFGTNNIPLPVYDNYRVYLSNYVSGVLDNNWSDITGSNLYQVVNNTLIWTSNLTNQYLMVRTDRNFLAYDMELLPIAGTVYFTFSELESRGAVVDNYVLPIPLGELDIFLNGKPLINGLDYIVKFPKVYIINKTHLVQPANNTLQKIHIRFSGFCNSDLEMDTSGDYGFIEHGVLSNNNRYDIRDDKVLRITCNGGLKHRDDVLFSEFHNGVSIVNSLNGNPYQVKDIVVPLKRLVDESTYSLRAKSKAIDTKVSDYMSIKLPQPPRNQVSAITNRYPLISPFLCHLINDLAINQFDNSLLKENLSDNEVLALCSSYEHLLDFDPIGVDNNFNSNYVIVYPHNLDNTINLTALQFRFITKVVRLYGRNLVELSPFVTFTAS